MDQGASYKNRGLALLVVAGLLASAVAGCGGGGGATGGGSGGETSSKTPQQGGEMTVAQGEEVSTLEPLEAILPAELTVVAQVSEPLWRENLEGKLVPWLVEKYETSNDDKTWTLHLKHGIKFSTGQPMTSADVVFTLERAKKSAYWEGLLEGIVGLKAPDPYTVVISTAVPAAELPAILSQWSFGIEPKNLGGESEKEFASDPIGTGPFKVGAWKRGESLTLDKNQYYWVPNRPFLDTLVFKTVTDPDSRTSQLLGGQLDVVYSPPWARVEEIEQSPETEFGDFPMGFLKGLQVNARLPKFQNIKLREAINLSLDREGMVEAVLRGHGEPAASFVPPPITYHDPNLKPPEHNVEMAKRLLAEAVKEGAETSFTLSVPNEDDFWVTAAQVVQQNLEEVGFQVKIEKLDTSSWFERLEGGKFEADTGFIYSAVPTPTEIFGGYNAFEGQFTGADTTETEKLFGEVLSEPNPAKRRQIYYHLQQIVADEQWMMPVVYEPFSWAYRSDVGGLYVGRIGIPWFSEAGLTE
ncbi:MAG: ABC transporter substrate-binding protein [Solirubrobacterales bacterium]